MWRDDPGMHSFMQSGVRRQIMVRLPSGATRPPSSIGFRGRTNHRPGLRRIAACSKRDGVGGSIIRRAQRRFEIGEPRASGAVTFK